MDKSLRQAYDYWQDQPDNSHVCTSLIRAESSAPGVWGNTEAPGREDHSASRCFTPFPEAGPGILFHASLPMQEFRNCQIPHGSKASRLFLKAALMLLPFRSTDPEQRVNSQSRLPRPQAGRASALDAPGFHWFTNPRKARDYERVTGT